MTEPDPAAPSKVQTTEASARRWSFASAVLDERTQELIVGGQLVEVERKPLEVLLHLLRHAGEVVTKDELLEAVWPGRVISDSALTSCIARLRGALGDEEQAIIKTAHGYGYRLVAPVAIEAPFPAPPPRFDFKPGDHPPQRPQWSLVERLGTGGHGEAWLARHDKTREQRVYKFALEAAHLVSLKREITLYRLMHDALGGTAAVVQVLDWNLDEPPYFIEAQYISGGNLVSWAEARGGLGSLPLQTRLEIAAQIAEALAAAHSIGVLHKDIKPTNVLIEASDDGSPRVRLCDFGSGGVLDSSQLDALGITRLGFTRKVDAPGTSSGTPMYLAPEVLAGQPATVKADVYALGLMLYQLAVANFHKSLAPGWERDIVDELLREDIALAAAGDPERRLGDAAILAGRLRSLPQRREQRAAEQRRSAHAAELAEQMQRTQARRPWIVAMVVLLLLGMAVSSALYFRARQDRARAVASDRLAREVNRFLNDDVLAAADPYRTGREDFTVQSLLSGAEGKLDESFKGQDAARAQIGLTLGRAYYGLGLWPRAGVRLSKALDDARSALGDEDPQTLEIEAQLAQNRVYEARYQEAQQLYDQVLAGLTRQFGPYDARTLRARMGVARLWWESDQFQRGVKEFETLMGLARAHVPELSVDIEWALADLYPEVNRLGDGEALARETLSRSRAQLGDRHPEVLWQSLTLGDTLILEGRWQEAEELFRAAQKGFAALGSENHPKYLTAIHYLGLNRLEQGQAREALPLLQAAMDGRLRAHGELHPWAHYSMNRVGEALIALHRPLEARAVLERALKLADQAGHRRQAYVLLILDNLAEADLALGHLERAEQWVSEGLETSRTSVPPMNLRKGLLQLTLGKLRSRQGRCAEAHENYAQAVAILSVSLSGKQLVLEEARQRAENSDPACSRTSGATPGTRAGRPKTANRID